MPSAGVLSELLVDLYSAPLEPLKWQVFFAQLCLATDCEMGVLTTSSSTVSEALAGGGINFDARPLELYNAHYGQLDPLLQPAIRTFRYSVIHDEELLQRSGFVKTEFYNDLLVPFGLHYVTVVPCFADKEQRDFITMFRGPRAGQMEADSTRLLSFLLPHMTNALETHHALRAANVHLQMFQAALNEIQAAAFVLTANGRILYMNVEAETLVRQNDGITSKNGCLGAWKQNENNKLTILLTALAARGIKNVAGDAGEPEFNTMLISRLAKPPLRLTVAPITDDGPLGTAGSVLCLVSDPLRKPKGLERVLTTLYGLTATECRLVDMMLDGFETKEAAAMLRMTYDSARFHMKTIFAKTGTHKQAELIRFLMSLMGTR